MIHVSIQIFLFAVSAHGGWISFSETDSHDFHLWHRPPKISTKPVSLPCVWRAAKLGCFIWRSAGRTPSDDSTPQVDGATNYIAEYVCSMSKFCIFGACLSHGIIFHHFCVMSFVCILPVATWFTVLMPSSPVSDLEEWDCDCTSREFSCGWCDDSGSWGLPRLLSRECG